MANRCDHLPLLKPRAVYEALKCLYPGDAIVSEVYVSDYRDGVIPDWRIHYRATRGLSILLIAFDMTNTYRPGGQSAEQLSLFEDDMRYPAVRIISNPAKIAVKSEAKR